MKKANVRVELKEKGRSPEDKNRAFKQLLSTFKRRVNEAGILSLYKQKQYYESPSEKRKRKRKEAEIESHKEKIRNYFSR
mgnify:CR=1 FL=1